jgi:hypothetical protein
MARRSSSVNFGASLPVSFRYAPVYLPVNMTFRNLAFSSRVAISAALTCSGESITGTAMDITSAGPTFVPGFPVARIAWTARP